MVVVYKFGGASLKDTESIKKVAEIIANSCYAHLIVVVSAMGKTTNALEKVFQLYIQNDKLKFKAFDDVIAYHNNILDNLFDSYDEVFFEIQKVYDEIINKLNQLPSDNVDYEYDSIVSYGELLSSKIVYYYLKHIGINAKLVDIRKVLITDSQFREANVDFSRSTEKVRNAFNENGLYLCQGFIAGTEDGRTTTLGREGSDYTAAAIGYIMDASSVTIWKDVPGVLTADPRIMPDVKKLDFITYKEAIELAYYGAQVIHPKTIKPLQNKNIPLYVKPFYAPDELGTKIQEFSGELNLPPIFIHKYQQVLISIMPKDFSFIVEENLSIIFQHLADLRIKINIMQLTAVSFSICIDYNEKKLNEFLNRISKQFNVLYNTHLTLITIRHYTDEAINSVIKDKEVLIKDISRKTAHIVIK